MILGDEHEVHLRALKPLSQRLSPAHRLKCVVCHLCNIWLHNSSADDVAYSCRWKGFHDIDYWQPNIKALASFMGQNYG